MMHLEGCERVALVTYFEVMPHPARNAETEEKPQFCNLNLESPNFQLEYSVMFVKIKRETELQY
jgi:hypothetical protein